MPTVSISLGKRSYKIHVENGALNRVGELAVQSGIKVGHLALVTDTNVAPLYADTAVRSFEKAGFKVSIHIISAGEQSKCLEEVGKLCSAFVKAGLDRSSTVAALGGGVVGDLAGFVASVYYRGISYIQIPTTIIAQSDSSIGGKTAVNIPEGKNLVGAFHQPKVVVIDPTTLVTLVSRTLAEGMAEVVKHAAIGQAEMIEELRPLGNEISIGLSLSTIRSLPDLLARNLSVKARIVEADEEERLNLRALLNFGHTIGHGIEASVPYGQIYHGEAVALGMRAALFLSEKKCGLSHDDSKALLSLLNTMDLPLVLPDHLKTEDIMEKIAKDKKFTSGSIRFILLPHLGEACVSSDVSVDDLVEAIESLRIPIDCD